MKSRVAAFFFFVVAVQGAADAAVRQVFVTSVSGTGNLGTWPDAGAATGLAAGDAICQARAAAAGLPNPSQYVAWISSTTSDAYCRLHGLTGKKSANCGQATLPAAAGPWLRTNGSPFAEAVPELLIPDEVVYLPARRDETGAAISGDFWTGTWSDGRFLENGTYSCVDWTSSGSDLGTYGSSERTGASWGDAASTTCSQIKHLLCFERGTGDPLPPFGNWGRLAFVTSVTGSGDLGSWPQAGGQAGLAAGDAICQNLAGAAGLPNATSFKAWLSTGATDARDRFANDGPWIRLDGIRLAANLAGLTDGSLNSALNLSETGVYYGNDGVWTGTDATGVASSNLCSDWTSASAATGGDSGVADGADGGWTMHFPNTTCDSDFQHIYCLQDLPMVFADGFESGDTSVWSSTAP